MAKTEPRIHEHDEQTDESTESTAPEMPEHEACHETVDPETRADVLDDYSSRCQACGRRGPKAGGLATLHVHHIERDPDGMDEHDMENLTLLCRPCHIWLHQQSTPDDAPVEITDADRTVLLPQDIEVLRFLAEHGPTRTGDIASGLTADLSVSAVRERLWVLMGLDNRVESREEQIVDKDVETGEWGLTEQIETSARGHIPDDQQLLLQRMEDEQVRQALERGCDRSAVTSVLGISRRTTFNKIKRAYAYDFPLEAFSRGGRPTNDVEQSAQSASGTNADSESEENAQQRLDAVDGDGDDLGRTETWGHSDATTNTSMTRETSNGDESDSGEAGAEDVRRELQSAIDALEAVDEAL